MLTVNDLFARMKEKYGLKEENLQEMRVINGTNLVELNKGDEVIYSRQLVKDHKGVPITYYVYFKTNGLIEKSKIEKLS